MGLPRAPTLLLLLLVFAAGLTRVHDWDLPLHARTGQWIVEHHAVPTLNVMSQLHATHPTVDDKWAFQVVAHLLLDGLGPNACIAAQIALMAALFLVLAATARALGADPWVTLLVLAVAALAARARFTLRPDLVSLLLTALVARELLLRPPSRGQALRLLLLQLAWVNLHGYFITGPLMVATAGLARLLAGPAERRRGGVLLLLAAGLCLACLLNPAGVDGALHPLRILRDLREHYDFYSRAILEFRPTFAADPRAPFDRDAFVLLLAAAAVLLPARLWRARRLPEARTAALLALALAALFALMAPSLRRNMAPFAIVAAPLLASALGGLALLRRAAPLAACALVVALVFGELSDRISVHDGLDRRAGLGVSSIAYPDAGLDFIARELPAARVFTSFTWGSTFTGRRWPAQVASTDGNTHGYPTSYLQEVFSALYATDPLAFERITARDGEDAALLPLAGPLSLELVGDPAWELACVGVREAVWVRRAARDGEWVAAHDLLAHWREGQPARLPDTPRDALLGPLAAERPLAELDQGVLLMASGLDELALSRAQAAAALAPGDPEPRALCGLLLAGLQRRDEALAALRQALELSGPDRFAVEARAVLKILGN